MSTFRPIQSAVAGRGAGASSLPTRPDPPEQPPKRKGRGRGTVQACDDCRRTKIKCDGQRPICSPCIAKDRPCGYVGAEGQTRAAAARTRLESLEKLATALREGSPDQASSILSRIRTTDDILEVIENSAASTHARSDEASRFSQLAISHQRDSDVMAVDASGTALLISSSEDGPPAPVASHEMAAEGSKTVWERPDEMPLGENIESSDSNRLTGHPTVTVPPSRTTPPALVQVMLPQASVTEHALESFFNCSGKLFHVFSRDEMSDCYHSVFDAQGTSSGELRASAGCLMAVASVGAQYMPGTFSRTVESGFYDLAKHFFEDVMEHRPLDAIKVCTLLAQYNIMGKATISLAYVEIGLGMSRMNGLGNRALRPQSMPSPVWVDLHKTWRTLVFFSSWLSSTLGYISGNHIVSEREILSEMRVEGEDDIAEIVQTEMAKICLVKAEILRMHLGFRGLTVQTMTSITNDLHTWYLGLPETIRIEAAGQEGLATGTKRTILHVHLLYLGAMMLMYRIAASQFVQSYANGTPSTTSQMPLRGLVVEQGVEAVLAARTSARILHLLLEDDGIFKRCWLVIFQAYTSCTVLLHAAIQKRLHNFDSSTWEEDMTRAKDCLTVLAFCGSGDRIASKFHNQLIGVYDKILATDEIAPGAGESLQDPASSESGPTSDSSLPTDAAQEKGKRPLDPISGHYLLHIPKDTNESRLKLTLSLLLMLSQPFGDPPLQPPAEADGVKRGWLGDPLRYEYPQNVERSDWDLESNVSFQWDFSKFDLSAGAAGQVADAVAASGSQDDTGPSFMGSDEPSGWASASHMTKGGEGS